LRTAAQETAETASNNNAWIVFTKEMFSHAFYIIDYLTKRIWFCPGALSVPSIIKGKDPVFGSKWQISFEIGLVVAYLLNRILIFL
jgi:hypothetical protein